MPWNEGESRLGELPFNDVQVGPTDAAGLDGNAHLTLSRHRCWKIPELKVWTRSVEDHRAHGILPDVGEHRMGRVTLSRLP